MGLDHHRVQFSILVVAYNRKEFLLNAVNSALNQTIEKSEFEVIVIKNFEDEKIDQEIAGLEIANILSDKASLGEKIIQGTLAAHGEYICLLEDDDQFSSHKLETIQKFVSEDVCFIHNSRAVVKYNDNKIRQQEEMPSQEKWYGVNKPSLKIFYRMLKSGLDFNCSSMTIKRDFILRNMEQIRQMTFRLDNLLFLSALRERTGMIELDLPLTLFRVHDNSLDRSNSYDDFIKIRRQRIIPYLNETMAIFQVMAGKIPGHFLLCYNLRIKSQMKLLGLEGAYTKISSLELFYGFLPKLPIKIYLYDIEIYLGSHLGDRVRKKLLDKAYRNALLRINN